MSAGQALAESIWASRSQDIEDKGDVKWYLEEEAAQHGHPEKVLDDAYLLLLAKLPVKDPS